MLGQLLRNNEMNFPESEPLSPGAIPFPFVIVADEAFPLKPYLMRPYAGRGGLNAEKNIFNYRLSRARRTVENLFALLVCQWRILKRPILASKKNTRLIVQAICCLHNFLRKSDIGINDYANETMLNLDERVPFTSDFTAYQEMTRQGNNNASLNANKVRNEFCRYFYREGAVHWQDEHR